MIDFDILALWLGRIILIGILLSLNIYLFIGLYSIYDYWLKKVLGWKKVELRKDLFYFIKHKEKIRKIIKGMK